MCVGTRGGGSERLAAGGWGRDQACTWERRQARGGLGRNGEPARYQVSSTEKAGQPLPQSAALPIVGQYSGSPINNDGAWDNPAAADISSVSYQTRNFRVPDKKCWGILFTMCQFFEVGTLDLSPIQVQLHGMHLQIGHAGQGPLAAPVQLYGQLEGLNLLTPSVSDASAAAAIKICCPVIFHHICIGQSFHSFSPPTASLLPSPCRSRFWKDCLHKTVHLHKRIHIHLSYACETAESLLLCVVRVCMLAEHLLNFC